MMAVTIITKQKTFKFSSLPDPNVMVCTTIIPGVHDKSCLVLEELNTMWIQLFACNYKRNTARGLENEKEREYENCTSRCHK